MRRRGHGRDGIGWASGLAVLLLLVPSVVATLPSGLPGITDAPWGAWRLETAYDDVDSYPTFMMLDSQDRPHIIFNGVHGGENSVMYASGSLLWEPLKIARGVHGGGAIDSQDRVHVGRQNVFPLFIGYERIDDGVIVVSEVAFQASTTVTGIRVAVDSMDRPHFGITLSGGSFMYAYRDTPGTWTTEIAYSGTYMWYDFRLDSQGRAHVIYDTSLASNNSLRYSVRELDGTWRHEFVSGCSTDPGLAIDSNDRPHVSCHGTGSGLVYLHHDGTQWVRETLRDPFSPHRSGTNRGWDTSIALDSQDRSHITYRDNMNTANPDDPLFPEHMKYAARTDVGWVYEIIDGSGNGVGLHSSISVDAHDRPHVSYVYGWRFFGLSCGHPANRCWDLSYAKPVVSVAGLAGT